MARSFTKRTENFAEEYGSSCTVNPAFPIETANLNKKKKVAACPSNVNLVAIFDYCMFGQANQQRR